MNNKKIILILLIPCYTHTWNWPWENVGIEAAKELTRGALKVVAAVTTVVYAPKTYTAARDTIYPSPDVHAQSELKKVRDCFQSHAGDPELTPHSYPIACRQNLIGFILARDRVETEGGDLDKIPKTQDLIDEFQHYRRNP